LGCLEKTQAKACGYRKGLISRRLKPAATKPVIFVFEVAATFGLRREKV
jgi:hypothetical protein